MFLLDTNSLIYFFKGEGAVAQNLAATPFAAVAIPSVVLYELETGLAKSKEPASRRRKLDLFLANVAVVPFEARDAAASALVRAQLEAAGTPIGPIDTMIAGTAMARKATVVTRNIREFSRVSGLTVANWFDQRPQSSSQG